MINLDKIQAETVRLADNRCQVRAHIHVLRTQIVPVQEMSDHYRNMMESIVRHQVWDDLYADLRATVEGLLYYARLNATPMDEARVEELAQTLRDQLGI